MANTSAIVEKYADRSAHLIGGELRASSGRESFSVVNPTTEAVVGGVAVGDADDVAAAVAAAKAAGRGEWGNFVTHERAGLLRALADGIESRGEDMVALVTEENGSIYPISYWGNVVASAAIYRYYADLIETIETEEVRPGADGYTLVRREPAGVAGLITAWNVPQGIAALKLAPSLAAGCTAVVKPAPETPFDLLLLAEIAQEAGFPPGVINVVFGGPETGRALVRHPDVRKVSFTGSPEAGRDVAVNAAETFKPVTLELGGKSAAILLEDVVLDDFLPYINQSCIGHSGQICNASTRLLVPRSRYAEVTAAVADTMKALNIGDPTDQTTELGPVASSRQRSRIEDYISKGLDQGAKLATGGGRPEAQEKGYFLEPTLFVDVANDMVVAQDEIFGPVLVAIPYDDHDQAVEIANDSRYGLGGTVFSADPERATQIARRMETGTVGINSYAQQFNAPYGGVKSSGYGRELGPEGIEPYFVMKSIYRTGAPDADSGEAPA